MASIRSLDGAFDLEPREISGRRFFKGVTTYWNAIREAREAAHAYDELVRRGTPHDVAVERVFEAHFSRR